MHWQTTLLFFSRFEVIERLLLTFSVCGLGGGIEKSLPGGGHVDVKNSEDVFAIGAISPERSMERTAGAGRVAAKLFIIHRPQEQDRALVIKGDVVRHMGGELLLAQRRLTVPSSIEYINNLQSWKRGVERSSQAVGYEQGYVQALDVVHVFTSTYITFLQYGRVWIPYKYGSDIRVTTRLRFSFHTQTCFTNQPQCITHTPWLLAQAAS